MTYPIPKEGLDDRLAILGTAGAGKTYLTLGAEEILLARGDRVIHVDPLGVAWGLRLMADGKAESSFNTVIFGGAHGDLPLNEHAGALVGETVATMRESCIIDLSGLGSKASERRFMLAFLTALYRHKKDGLVHLIIDEADMFAPQKLLDKEGDAAKLLGMMETIVRRGRVKGFIPWLITQRPAVLSKDVLSQADGLIALKLTASQDRDAIGAWIEGQADRQEGKAILASLPTMQRGQGVVWIPGRGVLKTAAFPQKITFDSSKTPERGKTIAAVDLKPINIDALKGKLANVVEEQKQNDPKALKAEIARLKGELQKAQQAGGMPDHKVAAKINFAAQDGYDKGRAEGREEGYLVGHYVGAGLYDVAIKYAADGVDGILADIKRHILGKLGEARGLCQAQDFTEEQAGFVKVGGEKILEKLRKQNRQPPAITNDHQSPSTQPPARAYNQVIPKRPVQVIQQHQGNGQIPKAERSILAALIHWGSASKNKIAVFTGYAVNGGGFNNALGALRSRGAIEGSDPIEITDIGRALIPNHEPMPEGPELLAMWLRQPSLGKAERAILEILFDALPNALSKEKLAERAGYAMDGGGFNNALGRLRTLELIEGRGDLKAAEMFQEIPF